MADPVWKFCGGIHGCQERRWAEEFRMLSGGYRAAYCWDCELKFDAWRRGRPQEEPAGLHPEALPGAVLIFPATTREPFDYLIAA